MNELLNLAVKAHGGLERWNKVKSIRVAASITGAIWFVKGKGDALKNIVMTVDTKAERLVSADVTVDGNDVSTGALWNTLRRLKLTDQAAMTYYESRNYSPILPNGKAYKFYFLQEVKSFITSPSFGTTMPVGRLIAATGSSSCLRTRWMPRTLPLSITTP